MFCIVLDSELTHKNVIEDLLVFKFRDTQFVLQKSTNPQNKLFGVQKLCTQLLGTVYVVITVSFPTFFLEK